MLDSTKGFFNPEEFEAGRLDDSPKGPQQLSGKATHLNWGAQGLRGSVKPGERKGKVLPISCRDNPKTRTNIHTSRQPAPTPALLRADPNPFIFQRPILAMMLSDRHWEGSCRLWAGPGASSTHGLHSGQLTIGRTGSGSQAACLCHCHTGRVQGKHSARPCLTLQTYLSQAEHGTAAPFRSSPRHPSSWDVISPPLKR